jgi:hypothetical protein
VWAAPPAVALTGAYVQDHPLDHGAVVELAVTLPLPLLAENSEMRRISAASVCFPLALAIASGASGAPAAVVQSLSDAQAPIVANGVLQGAPYRIDIPAHWNGSLVMLMHGYEPKGMPRSEPWPQNEAAPVFLQRGYAVAASAYSSQG